MNKPSAWELWYAHVKYEDLEIYKDRPVLVIDAGDEIAIIALKVTSTEKRDLWGEYDIIKWKSAGLKNASTVRCTKVLSLHLGDFRRKIGDLQLEDILKIKEILQS